MRTVIPADAHAAPKVSVPVIPSPIVNIHAARAFLKDRLTRSA